MSDIVTLDKRVRHDYGYENRLYSQVVEMQRCGIISYKLLTHEVLMMNEMAKEMYGLDPNSPFTEAELFEAIKKFEYDDPENTKKRLRKLKKAGDKTTFTIWVTHADGSRLHLWVATKLIQMDLDELVVVSSVQDITAITQLESTTARLAEERDYKDKVTGGHNRSGFEREVELLLSTVEDRSEYAILCFDIKNFKAVNEIYGRAGGDQLLCDFYKYIKNSEIHPLVIARLQADHIACLTKKKHVNPESFTGMLNGTWTFEGRSIHIYATSGIYYLEKDEKNSVSKMVDHAKLANHYIIDQYVKPYAVFDDKMSSNYVDQAEILATFENGIANQEFKVFYQPVMVAAIGNLVSAEALVRWVSKEKGVVSPGVFIPTLEKNGHISKLDHYVIKSVFSNMEERAESKKVTVPVSINLSWMDFYDENMMEWLLKSLDETKIPTGHARFEVTETSFAALEQNGINVLDKLKERKAITLLDDFGSGYSSFGMLKNYNFDILKIDLSFVKALEENEKVRYIIAGIIDMCHKIGIKVVAEGAENENQVEFLKKCSCDYIQGYYFSRPLDSDSFEAMLEEYSKLGKIGATVAKIA